MGDCSIRVYVDHFSCLFHPYLVRERSLAPLNTLGRPLRHSFVCTAVLLDHGAKSNSQALDLFFLLDSVASSAALTHGPLAKPLWLYSA